LPSTMPTTASIFPTSEPTQQALPTSSLPTANHHIQISLPSCQPTSQPSALPSFQPSSQPSMLPTNAPSTSSRRVLNEIDFNSINRFNILIDGRFINETFQYRIENTPLIYSVLPAVISYAKTTTVTITGKGLDH
jgi:hypothetical protein